MQFEFEGPPIPQHRPRFKVGKKRKVSKFTNSFGQLENKITVKNIPIGRSDQNAEKNSMRWQMTMQKISTYDLIIRAKTPIKLEILFYFEYPPSASKRKRILAKEKPIPMTVKPDLDNLIKFILDCGNKVLWEDDNIIFDIHAKKYYADCAKTVLRIYPVEE